MEKEKPENPVPTIIEELNKTLKQSIPEGQESPTVERIAQKVGISRNILYKWVETDVQLSDALGLLKTIQDNDPFKTGTIEDAWVGSVALAFILMETRDRHYKPNDN